MPSPDPFETTHWSLILVARNRDDPRYHDALTALCQSYWQLIYAYIRRCGNDAHAAEDRTQGFFASLLEPKALAGVDREKGKLRAFLLRGRYPKALRDRIAVTVADSADIQEEIRDLFAALAS